MSEAENPPWLIVAGDFSPAGGMDRANYHLAWHLADRAGREVHLVAHRVAEPLAGHPRVRAHLVPRPLSRHFLGGLFLDGAGRRAARTLTARHPATRVVVNGGNCRWAGVNWVHLVHNASRPADEAAPWLVRLRHRVAGRAHRRQERQAFDRCPLLLANSARTQSDLVEGLGVPPGRVRVVYLGCDPATYGPVSPGERAAARKTLSLSEGQVVVAFVGALGHDRRKGFDTLLAAAAQVRRRAFPEFSVVAGGGGTLDHWRREAARLGLAERVRFLGHVAFIPALLAAADLLVSPARYEPYGLNVHEALCREVPAIVSRCAGVAERYPPELADLLLDDPDDPGELADRMAAWLAQRQQFQPALERVGAELRSRTWDDMAEEMIGLVENHYDGVGAVSERAGR
jgi:glycosyltransferase involved in cell wall biosynthesis